MDVKILNALCFEFCLRINVAVQMQCETAFDKQACLRTELKEKYGCVGTYLERKKSQCDWL